MVKSPDFLSVHHVERVCGFHDVPFEIIFHSSNNLHELDEALETRGSWIEAENGSYTIFSFSSDGQSIRFTPFIITFGVRWLLINEMNSFVTSATSFLVGLALLKDSDRVSKDGLYERALVCFQQVEDHGIQRPDFVLAFIEQAHCSLQMNLARQGDEAIPELLSRYVDFMQMRAEV